MKVIIAGSRTIKPYPGLISYAVYCSGFDISEVVCGNAAGVDSGGAAWAKMYNLPVKYFEPNWQAYGRRAGYLRNSAMAEYADALIALWDGASDGTRHMINIGKKRNMPMYVLTLAEARFNIVQPELIKEVARRPAKELDWQ